jgi:SAM-dependent methyltransferase
MRWWSRYSHVAWPLTGFSSEGRRYPTRELRYWFMASLLRREAELLGRPLRVLEIGIASGELPRFIGKAAWKGAWHGVDIKATNETRALYDRYIEANLDAPLSLTESYDAVVALHVLEHLINPERALEGVLRYLSPQGVLIGGSPTMPTMLARLYEPRLRRRYRHVPVTEHRHLSVVTPSRVRAFAAEHQLSVDLLTGTFLCRASRSPLEDYAFNMRLNLLWGAFVPSLGGEMYFALRKT